ncbi:dihydrolipoyllysine-residue acetyltransferase component of pyruvate dehydrogenase complex [Arthrobacter sp. Hiyo8]|nr:dihydrolipoyllysine-residue acetyltransferase component of pyruvate dehydrogenase complex [Arthrobacter sp. Hiyo8]
MTLPALGESVTEGTVTRWLKAVGDSVEVDEPLLEVSTDKVDTEIPSPVAGTLLEIRVNEDETAEVGSVLAVIGSGAPAAAAPAPAAAPAAPAPVAAAPPHRHPSLKPHPRRQQHRHPQHRLPGSRTRAGSSSGTRSVFERVRLRHPACPQACQPERCRHHHRDGHRRRRPYPEAGRARRSRRNENGCAGSSRRSGAGGRSSRDTRQACCRPVAASSLRGTVEKAPRIRQVIARRMRESLETSTQLTQVHEVDMTKIAKLRLKAKGSFEAQNGVKLTFLPFIAKAVAEALKQHPKLNAAYDEDKQEITYHNAEHLAIAVDTDKGLLVPVISDAGNLNLAGLASKIADVAGRTRQGKIGPDELSGGTFSITNIGSVGALFDTPIINQPQVGILGTGAIVKRPVVVADENGDDSIAIRSMMYLSLTYDHRLVDGADAGRFLQTLRARLEEGAFEADLGL